ncbi:MAG TPA: 30S ribosomal protein S12 methylthiotransferase RimO [Rectinemataceae bacterium]|nr:30S ribosomal protein S12 methylthiotransferase RimO [Rectinemataceae bacterium]
MKFFIDQHGCAKNQVDGEEIAARLEDAGYEYVSSGEDADLIIVNTCGFIESAKRESIDATIAIKALWPDKKVLVAGCLAQRYPEALMDDMAEVDGVFGNADLSLVADSVGKTLAGDRRAIVPAQPATIGGNYYARKRFFDFPGVANVKVTEGCNNRCTYCAIPLIRGELRSRSIEDVMAECRNLIQSGVYEINLIGQDLGVYGWDLRPRDAADDEAGGGTGAGVSAEVGAGAGAEGKTDLPALLAALSSLEGEFRVRVLYIHPDHFPKDILKVMARDPRILPYFDLPFQHASEGILRAMNRTGSKRKYLDLVATIRAFLPESMIRCTFLVGFPGETEEDFSLLQAFQAEARLDWMGVFTYSREEGTPAYSMKGRVSKKTATMRKNLVESAQEVITSERLKRFVGAEVEVIAEESVEGSELSLCRAWMQAPEVDGLTVVKGALKPGERMRVKIVAVNGVDFEAEPALSVEPARPAKPIKASGAEA